MAETMALSGGLDAAIAFASAPASTIRKVPTTRPVRNLDAALRAVRRLGGSVTSETRTAPGIGSWAFVTDRDGAELVLWEDATPPA
jgi:predicted enzyme related to lactoylglutathione lyase